MNHLNVSLNKINFLKTWNIKKTTQLWLVAIEKQQTTSNQLCAKKIH